MNSASKQADNPALTINKLCAGYGNTPVLRDISLEVPPGVVVEIIGPNGAGKSSLIKVLLGLLQPSCGSVLFFGKELKHVRETIAYIPQRETVDWDFPIIVRDLVLMGRYGKMGLLKRPSKEDYLAADYYLEAVGMSDYAGRQINELSGGQQQRVFIARALCQEADIYLMDEPFANIDAATEKTIVELWVHLKKQNKTVFVVHHDLGKSSHYYDWAIILNIRLIACGPVDLVYRPEHFMEAYGQDFAFFEEIFHRVQTINSVDEGA